MSGNKKQTKKNTSKKVSETIKRLAILYNIILSNSVLERQLEECLQSLEREREDKMSLRRELNELLDREHMPRTPTRMVTIKTKRSFYVQDNCCVQKHLYIVMIIKYKSS